MLKKSFGGLQQVGKALMLPVALLPAAGLLLAFGNAFQNPQLLKLLPLLNWGAFQGIAQVMEQAGNVIFSNLALLFAVGVAVGMSAGEGVAGLAAIVGFLIMNVTMGQIAGVTEAVLKNPMYTHVLGIPTLQTGVFGGIIVGVLASYVYKRYYNIELPSYLGFFAGKRFVPILTAVYALILGIIMTFIWPFVQNMLNTFSHDMIDTNKTLAAFIFGVVERGLIPFGLHHIWYNPFWYQFGDYVNLAGQLINGDQRIFFAQMKDGVPFTAGTFLTGKFPFMMFGLPAAALAMYHEAKPEKKSLVAGILGSAALTSFLTGITEPIEFSFLFLAPALFGIHCIFAGFSFMIMHLLNVKIGMTFSGGVIDFILFGVIPNRTEWWLVIPVGLAFSVIYYFGFRFAIRKWNLKTPGREEETEESTQDSIDSTTNDRGSLAANVLAALGGKQNIKDLDACITRLRVGVNDIGQVNKVQLKKLGAAGVMEVGNNIQVIFGPKSDQLKTQIKNVMDNNDAENEELNITADKQIRAQKSEIHATFIIPLDGKLVSLADVPDQVFSQKIMGDGFAIEPVSGELISPVSGTLTTLFPTKHAFGITTEDGTEILIHFGINTVDLGGKGLTALVEQGDMIKAGQPLLSVDLPEVRKSVPSLMTPIIFTNLREDEKVVFQEGQQVMRGQTGLIRIEKA